MSKNSIGAEIRQAREAASLSLSKVGYALGRSFEWVRRIETGTLAVTPEKAKRILETIARLRKNPSFYEPLAPRVRKNVITRTEKA